MYYLEYIYESKGSQIWQFDHLEDAIAKLEEISTLDDSHLNIQSELELRGRYSTVSKNGSGSIFSPNLNLNVKVDETL